MFQIKQYIQVYNKTSNTHLEDGYVILNTSPEYSAFADKLLFTLRNISPEKIYLPHIYGVYFALHEPRFPDVLTVVIFQLCNFPVNWETYNESRRFHDNKLGYYRNLISEALCVDDLVFPFADGD